MTSYASRKMILQLFLVIDMETERGAAYCPLLLPKDCCRSLLKSTNGAMTLYKSKESLTLMQPLFDCQINFSSKKLFQGIIEI